MRRTLLFIAVLACAPSLHAQTRIVTGRVLDSLSGDAVTAGQVTVTGTSISTSIRDDGTFSIGVPTRDVFLVVRSIGFKRRDQAVAASQDAVDVRLERDYFQLEAIVVTGQATGVEKRNLANAVATVGSAEVAKVSAPTLEQALGGKMAGVQLSENSGAPGGGMRVRLRGATSLIGGGNPLYVVDGVIASDARIEGGMNAVSLAQGAGITSVEQMNPVNRIADLNPNDIESVEVLKGASAAAIYGSKAANGVILITTKRGRVGVPQFQIRQGIGTAMRAFTFGARYFNDLASAVQAFGATAAQHWTPGYVPFNLEDDITGYKPLQYETSASMSGGTETTMYFASALVRHEGGIAIETYADKASLRLNLDQQIGPRFKVSTGTEVMRTANDRGMFGNDNAGTSYYFVLLHHPNFFDLRAVCPDGSRQAKCTGGVYPVNPYVTSNPLQSAVLMTRDEVVFRMLSSLRGQLDVISSPQHSLRLLGTGGIDQFVQEDNIVSPPELQFEPNDGLPGTVVRSFGNSFQGNMNANLVHTFRSAGGILSATTQFGTQYEYQRLVLDRTANKGLIAGTPTIAAGTRQSIEQEYTKVKDFGYFAQEELLLFSERLLLTGGVRADRSSNNADTRKFFYYPKASVSFRFTSVPGPVDELKLRAAYGQTGNRPLFGQKFSNLNATNVGGVGGVTVAAAAGAADARPERQTEIEAGFDAQMLGSRALLEVSLYQKTSEDLLLQRTLAPVTGFTSEVFNGAAMRVRGLEVGLNLTPVRSTNWTWTSNLNWAMNRSKITRLPVPPFNAAGGSAGAIRIVEGGSATALWANDTLQRASSTAPFVLEFRHQGDAAPSWTGGLVNTIQYRALSLSAGIEAVRGGLMNAGSWRHWDIQRNGYDFEEPGNCGGPTLGACRLALQNQVPMNYWRNAGYVKLREVTLVADLPKALTDGLWTGLRHVKVSISGRNLLHVQKIIGGNMFRGTDPAAANYHSGNQRSNNVAYTREFAAYPSTRSFWFTLDLGF